MANSLPSQPLLPCKNKQPASAAAPTGILLLAWMLCAGTAAAMAPRTLTQMEQSGTLSLANPGVSCDPAGQAGYDRQGNSQGITRATYGHKAEERLVQHSRGRPVPREFWLGKGEVCSLPRQTCWEEGWSRSGGFGSGPSDSNGIGVAPEPLLATLRLALFLPAAGSGTLPAPAASGCGSSGINNSGMGRPAPPVTINLPDAGSCMTYSGHADSFRLNLNRGQWLQVQAVDRGIALLAPSGRSLPLAHGSGEWQLPEGGTYGVKLEVPPGEGMGVRFCLR